MTFHGTFRGDHHVMEHAHESPRVMTVPLMVLALGALSAGFLLHSICSSASIGRGSGAVHGDGAR